MNETLTIVGTFYKQFKKKDEMGTVCWFFGVYEIVWIAYTCSEGNVSISLSCERWHRYLIIKGRWCFMS